MHRSNPACASCHMRIDGLGFALENRMTLREVGDLYIERILSLSRGNKVQAARALGINRRTLYRRGGAPKQRQG